MKSFIKKNWLLILMVLYFLSPIDIIPDALPAIGLGDDAVLAIIALISKYLDYRKELELKKNSTQNKPEEKIVDGEVVE